MSYPEFSDADYDEQFWHDEEYNEMEDMAESDDPLSMAIFESRDD